MAAIAGYIGMANVLMNQPKLLPAFMGIDAFVSNCALFLVGAELAQMPLRRDPEEGSLFASEQSHLMWRIGTAVLFGMWGLAQWRRVVWHVLEWQVAKPHVGPWSQWLAMLKVLCAGAAAVLGLHALPSVRWKHKRLPA